MTLYYYIYPRDFIISYTIDSDLNTTLLRILLVSQVSVLNLIPIPALLLIKILFKEFIETCFKQAQDQTFIRLIDKFNLVFKPRNPDYDYESLYMKYYYFC